MGTRRNSLVSGLVVVAALLVSPLVGGHHEAMEKALAIDTASSKVQWGPCPGFLPAGCQIAVLRGDPAKPNADMLLRLPPNSSVPVHWHTSAERMMLVSGELHVTYEGQETDVLRAGSYAYGPAKLPHDGRCADAGPCVLFVAFEGPVDAHEGKPGMK